MGSRRFRGAAALAVALPLWSWIAAACSGGGEAAAPVQGVDAALAIPAPAVPDASASFAIDQDFPDPDVLATGDGYFAFATNAGPVNVQVAWSRDLESWQVRRVDALPKLPPWARRGRTWAPEVSAIGGRYVMYFTAEDWVSGRQCIGAAVASRPEGPYESESEKPLVCPLEAGGAIDASTFVDDDGTANLLYKTDGNCCGLPTRIQLAQLSADGTALVDAPIELIRQTERWEGALVEAPTLLKRDGRYVLLYSANDYAGANYAVGYATATAIGGPYAKGSGPFMSTSSSALAWFGPGGQDVATAPDGTDCLIFHSWDAGVRYRGMGVARLSWNDGRPALASATQHP